VQVQSLVSELTALGYVRPALDAEIPDPETGRVLAVAEAFWPDGFQPGLGKPVVLELDPDEADIPRLDELGYDVFTSVDALRGYVRRLTDQTSGDRDAGSGASGLADIDPVPEEVESGGAFERALFGLIERCRTELSYNPNYLRDMAYQNGALGAAQRLLASPTVSDGFVRLWDAGRLDLTVEALATDDRFAHLFTEKELDTARRRLDVVRRDPVGAGRR
jgi:hypothetical protein